VAVAGADGKAEIRAVETGPRFRDLWVIEKGVKAGENVIVSGLQYLRAGTPVAAKPAPAASPTAAQASR
jgi:multidrug efflux pump subunit AcrA (membrane-fusion protein)